MSNGENTVELDTTATGDSLAFRRILLAEAHPLRQRVLRPNMRAEDIVLPGDDAPETQHVGMFIDGVLAGIASLYRVGTPHHPEISAAWQIRMFGIVPECQGRGYAPALMDYCLQTARTQGGVLVWGNARIHVAPLYERLGFQRRGEEFEVPGVCMHVYMELFL